MAFLSLFGKSAKPHAETDTQGTDPCISERLSEISERLRKIETKQKETSLQLEEIDGFLQGDANADAADTENALVDALIAIADTIGDFYYFAAAGQGGRGEAALPDEDARFGPNGNGRGFVLVNPDEAASDSGGAADRGSPLFEQAQMMWNTAKSAAETAGLEIIDAEREAFDFRLHSAESIGQDNDIPNGYVIKTLKCGYVYKDEVMRRAAVLVNKINTPNIMYPKEAFDEGWD